jgi:tetratricopeptide (TPR) repeat protein
VDKTRVDKQKTKYMPFVPIVLGLVMAAQIASLLLVLIGGSKTVPDRQEVLALIEKYYDQDGLSAAEGLAVNLLCRNPLDAEAALWVEKINQRQNSVAVPVSQPAVVRIIEKERDDGTLREQARVLADLRQSIEDMKHGSRSAPIIVRPVEKKEAAAKTDAETIDPEALGRYLAIGISSYQAGDFLTAKEALLKVLAADPSHAYANAYLGATLFGENPQNEEQSKAALSYCKKAIDTDKTNKLAYRTLGNIYESRGDRELAVINYLEASGIDPADAELLFTLGRLYYLTGDLRQADAYCAKALKEKADMPLAYYYQALCARKQGSNERAVALLTSAIAGDPRFYGAYGERGEIRFSLQEYEKAIDDFRAALSIRAGFACRVRIGDCYVKCGQPDRAIVEYRAALDMFPPTGAAEKGRAAELYLFLAEALYEKGDTGEAYAVIRQAIASGTVVPALYLIKGRIELANKQTDSARESFERLIRIDPGSVEGYCELALLYQQTGKHAQADNLIRELVTRNPRFAENKRILDTWQALGAD